MNFIGSKKTILPYIEKIILSSVSNSNEKIFCDLFSGTAIVGQKFREHFKKIISNDIEYFSYVLTYNNIKINSQLIFDEKQLLTPIVKSNFFIQEYAYNRNYFTPNNAKTISFIRNNIEKYSGDVYYHLLASLIYSADKYANTTSVYAAYLKKYKDSAMRDFKFEYLDYIVDGKDNEVYNKDANELIKEIEGNVLYLDPPYNRRQYSSNYHILNTIAKNDIFEPKGKTGLRHDMYSSSFCSKRRAKEAFEEIIREAKFEDIFISYSNQGVIEIDDLKNILIKYGELKESSLIYNLYKADKREYREDELREFIFHLKKK